jgi:SnoaL-like domain
MTTTNELLEKRLQMLEGRVHRLESVAAIERLQRMYGYYLDNRMWKETVDLFTDDGEVEVGRRGLYRGREQLRTFFFDVLGRGRSGRARNELHNHIQIQGVVTLDETERAFGRFRALAQFAAQLADGTPGCGWAEGIYENEYVYRDGSWRIHVLRWTPSFYGMLPAEAIAAGRPSAPVSERFPPSAPPTYAQDQQGAWILPFHYPHPHTGKQTPVP